MDILKQNLDIEVKVTPNQLADLFCSMDDREQANFFNCVYDISQTWPSCNFDMQMLSVSRCGHLTAGGRDVMQTIGMIADESD